MRSTILVALVLLAGCSGSKPAATSFELTTEDATRYVARIWTTTSANQNTIADAVAKATTGGAKGSMTLACRPGTAVVQIVRFASDADALKGSTAPISGIPAAAETRLLRVVSSATGAGAAPVITFSKASSVQFSEFVMRPGKTPDELQEMVKTMHESMTSGGGAPTLASIAQFRANDDKALAMLALWKTKEGMEVFAREKTFGDAPYWDPYATNEHWMCSVAHIG